MTTSILGPKYCSQKFRNFFLVAKNEKKKIAPSTESQYNIDNENIFYFCVRRLVLAKSCTASDHA